MCAAVPASALEVPRANRTASALPLAPAQASTEASLATLLALQSAQAARLNRLYDNYAAQRLAQESKIVQWQAQLRRVQSPQSFDERLAARLLRDIREAQASVASGLLSARARALASLSSVQRAQLESVPTDKRVRVRRDYLYHLLLMPVAQLESLPHTGRTQSLDGRAYPQSRSARRRGAASYSVYGGYAYGQPQYGVGARYGRGSVGVHAGVGRGGPSVGISIGGVLGQHW